MLIVKYRHLHTQKYKYIWIDTNGLSCKIQKKQHYFELPTYKQVWQLCNSILLQWPLLCEHCKLFGPPVRWDIRNLIFFRTITTRCLLSNMLCLSSSFFVIDLFVKHSHLQLWNIMVKWWSDILYNISASKFCRSTNYRKPWYKEKTYK